MVWHAQVRYNNLSRSVGREIGRLSAHRQLDVIGRHGLPASVLRCLDSFLSDLVCLAFQLLDKLVSRALANALAAGIEQ
jgi:hypothetical protein